MHIHIQNEVKPGGNFEVSHMMIEDSCARAGLKDQVVTTIARDEAGFVKAIATANFVLLPVSIVRDLLPCPAPRLIAVMCPSVGLEVLSPYEWLPPGVFLTNNGGAQADKGGEYAILALLMLANRIPDLVRFQQHENWDRVLGGRLKGRRLTIVGLGNLGSAAARWAKIFDMDVTGIRTTIDCHTDCDRVFSFNSIDKVLPSTDFLLLACPLTDLTKNLINRERLGLLQRGAYVVNIGRGALVDEEALCDALELGSLGGAVLDVFATEPLPRGHRLWNTRGVIVTPHISAQDPNALMPNTLDILFANVRRHICGEALSNVFLTERGY